LFIDLRAVEPFQDRAQVALLNARERYRAMRQKHVPRYLAGFEYGSNRRHNFGAMIPRLACVALRIAPMPYRILKLADVYA
jgi:hypothetical protein